MPLACKRPSPRAGVTTPFAICWSTRRGVAPSSEITITRGAAHARSDAERLAMSQSPAPTHAAARREIADTPEYVPRRIHDRELPMICLRSSDCTPCESMSDVGGDRGPAPGRPAARPGQPRGGDRETVAFGYYVRFT